GYRIELGEIENVLLSHPEIDECTVSLTTEVNKSIAKEDLQFCVKCGIASNYPNTVFSEEMVCSHCSAFEKYRDVAEAYFSDMQKLQKIVDKMCSENHPKYDCIVSLSGGKDSTYALCKIKDMGARVLAFTLDNGYISERAKDNINRTAERLGIEHRYISTTHMNEIFVDSLQRHSDVCNGCFKTIYTMAINLALEVGVKYIVTGLSKGQLFETRLSELFRMETFDEKVFDKNLIQARKVYHRVEDSANCLLENDWVDDDDVLENIRFVDFFRYSNVLRNDMYGYIEDRVGWVRPPDTGRSTNCLLNDVAIYVHGKERGYHKYSLPYSWDVRMGHIEKGDALREIDDSAEIDEAKVSSILNDLGYEVRDETLGVGDAQIVAYYKSDVEIPVARVDEYMAEALPEYMVPSHFIRLEKMPLTPNGKLNRQALPRPNDYRKNFAESYVAPRNELEEKLAELWKEVLMVDKVGIEDNFFEIGGNSLPALMLLFKVDSQYNKLISIQEFSEDPTIKALSSILQ
ncbi:phosphopantetheine-binding protein, partial [Spartinivicinus marinus]